METNLLDKMLDMYLTDQTPVTMTLQNKIRITGKIKAYDSYIIVLDGKKREIVYRHAVCSLCPNAASEHKQFVRATTIPSSLKQSPDPKPPKTASFRSKTTHHHQALSASGTEQSIHNTMKDGLLKWMQEQKAVK